MNSLYFVIYITENIYIIISYPTFQFHFYSFTTHQRNQESHFNMSESVAASPALPFLAEGEEPEQDIVDGDASTKKRHDGPVIMFWGRS
jgi:hypothetical protein